MNRKPKQLIFDRNVDFNQAKLINDKKAEQRNLDACKAKVDQILAQHNVIQLPAVKIIGNQMQTNILYVTRPPAPPDSKVN
jgi:hypothetical protein